MKMSIWRQTHYANAHGTHMVLADSAKNSATLDLFCRLFFIS